MILSLSENISGSWLSLKTFCPNSITGSSEILIITTSRAHRDFNMAATIDVIENDTVLDDDLCFYVPVNEGECNTNSSRRKNIKMKDIPPDESIHTDFKTDFKSGLPTQVPCDIKLKTTKSRLPAWIDSCQHNLEELKKHEQRYNREKRTVKQD